MNFEELMREKILVYDGSKGYLLMQKGLAPGDYPDLWNLDHPGAVHDIHRAYIDAGADVIQTNTLQASRFHMEAKGLYDKQADINRAGVGLAKRAAGGRALVAASIGPLGTLMAPFGETGFDEVYAAFYEQIGVLLDSGADILHFETFTDLSELRIAVLAAKDLDYRAPIIATISIEQNGRTVMGDDAACAAASLAMLGASCAGANCGLAPREMLAKFGPFTAFGNPLCSKPNAGAPVVSGGIVNYSATKEEFYDTAFGFARFGARLIGGCCGSGPEHVQSLRDAADIMNSNAEYNFSDVVGDAPANKDIVKLYSHGSSAAFSRSAIIEYASDATQRMAGRPAPGATSSAKSCEPEFYESHDGKMLTVDIAGMLNERRADADKIVEVLSDAAEMDAEATIFSLITKGRFGGMGNENAGSGGARELLGMVASNARAYHNKPALFHTDDMEALNSALRQYCGAPAILARHADEKQARTAAGHLSPVVITI